MDDWLVKFVEKVKTTVAILPLTVKLFVTYYSITWEFINFFG